MRSARAAAAKLPGARGHARTLKCRQQLIDASRNTLAGGIDRQVIAIPGMIVAPDHLLPIRKHEAGNLIFPGADTAAMLVPAGA